MFVMRKRLFESNTSGYIAPPADGWEIPVARVTVGDEIGVGQYGKVFRGMVTGGIRELGNRVTVALKQSHTELVVDDIKAFFAEATAMKKFSDPHHPNVGSLDNWAL